MTTVIPAIVDGLARPTGAVSNGDTFDRPRHHRHPTPNRNGEIRIVQPAVEGWACDTCNKTGDGGGALLHHASVTNHHIYTAL